MKNALFIGSIILLIFSVVLFSIVTSIRNSSRDYWGNSLSPDGLWLSKENSNLVRYRVKEQVKGSFAGTEIPTNQEKDLLTVRFVDDIDKTDYKVTIPRVYNGDNITLTPTEIVTKLTSKGSAVIDLIDPTERRAGYINSIFFPPVQ